ncbi:hypothetical protein [Devosia sp. 2618]|uniref:hypothetical protein n=1 Tax=Devosia sp. 2618 TaxID=3156454 RepID=UPI00339450B2
MAKTYKVQLTDGSVISIEGVASVDKDGSGLRLKGNDGEVIASFDDGQSKACWPASSTVKPPPAE